MVRYLHAKKYSDSINLLASGAIAMLNHGQVSIRPLNVQCPRFNMLVSSNLFILSYHLVSVLLQVTCGTELGLLLIQTMNVAKVPFDNSAIGKYHVFWLVEVSVHCRMLFNLRTSV